jgi:hypothetical protein
MGCRHNFEVWPEPGWDKGHFELLFVAWNAVWGFLQAKVGRKYPLFLKMPNPDADADFKKKFEPTCLEKKKKTENSDWLCQFPTNNIFRLSPSEQLSVNINVGSVFWQLQRSKSANFSTIPPQPSSQNCLEEFSKFRRIFARDMHAL